MQRGNRPAANPAQQENEMKAMKQIMVAAALSAGLVTAAQAHMFVGVGIVGGPVFPVGSTAQSAPPLPVYPEAIGRAPLPPDAPPPVFAEPVVSSYSALIGDAATAPGTGQGVNSVDSSNQSM